MKRPTYRWYHMLGALKNGATTLRILCDDTDAYVLMVYWYWKTVTTCHLQMAKWDGKVLDINYTVQNLGEKCSSILAIHSLSGCDTTSYPAGKVSALKSVACYTQGSTALCWRAKCHIHANHGSCWSILLGLSIDKGIVSRIIWFRTFCTFKMPVN